MATCSFESSSRKERGAYLSTQSAPLPAAAAAGVDASAESAAVSVAAPAAAEAAVASRSSLSRSWPMGTASREPFDWYALSGLRGRGASTRIWPSPSAPATQKLLSTARGGSAGSAGCGGGSSSTGAASCSAGCAGALGAASAGAPADGRG